MRSLCRAPRARAQPRFLAGHLAQARQALLRGEPPSSALFATAFPDDDALGRAQAFFEQAAQEEDDDDARRRRNASHRECVTPPGEKEGQERN